MVKTPTISELFEAGVHFGHLSSKCHPKMKQYIYGVRSNIHIIDLEKTVDKLKLALEFITKVVSQKGKVLLVGTIPQAKQLIKETAEKLDMPYVNERWLGGTLTNFKVIMEKVKKMDRLAKEKEEGYWSRYTKKERLNLGRELAKLKVAVAGLKELTKLPEAIFVVGLKKEKTVVQEAKAKNVPIIGLVNTNFNPELIDYPILVNDKGIKSIQLIVSLVNQAIMEGLEKAIHETKDVPSVAIKKTKNKI
ncbi:MAG: 30S ribosomal protein S2 [Candidatus Aenigmarchaeota archaeon]|nr:30S ribosomal protein S2 [Candidatus Aenigmarchaeota archaeon]